VKSEYFSFERPNFHPEQIIVMKCSLHILSQWVHTCPGVPIVK